MPVAALVELGTAIEKAWGRIDYASEAFPALAADALLEAGLPGKLSIDEIVDEVLGTMSLPQQEDPTAMFGQPPVTLFRARRFYIDTLFWVDGTTTIHQHAFSGAFGVLHGSSIETTFSFESTRNVDGLFKLGTLKVQSSGLLRKGDVRPIASGSRLIHSIFHLERPSVSVVIRTYRDVDAGPQLEYAMPGVAHDPFFRDPTRDRALQLVKMLRTVEHPNFERVAGDLIARADLHTAYRILRDCAGLPDRGLFERLLERVRDATIVPQLRAAFEQMRHLAFLHSRRALVQDADLRFFLGVLLNAQCRRDALELVRARVDAARPERVVSLWLRRLSTVTAKLQVGGTAWEPNLLGLPPFDDRLEAAIEALLAGDPSSGTPALPLLDQVRNLPALACLWK